MDEHGRRIVHRVDIAFLPINGRDARRHELGTPGNCTIEEALTIGDCAGVEWVIPHHYDMFKFNCAPIDEFISRAAQAYPQQKILAPKTGSRVIYSRVESSIVIST